MISKKTIQKVSGWDVNNFHTLLSFIESIWSYPAEQEHVKAFRFSIRGADLVCLEINTFNLADNIQIVAALQKTEFWKRSWQVSYNDGRHDFEIYPGRYDFKLCSKFSKDTGISKVMIHRCKEKYDWFIVSNYKRFVRFKKESHE